MERTEWPLWEIFIRSQHGLAHKHVGSLHAPDAEMAIKNARDVYTRRNEGVSIWVMWCAYDSEVETRISGGRRTGDELAFLRDGTDFRNLLLVEQPNGNYADTIARQFYFDVWHQLLLAKLAHSADARIAEIAAKALK